MTCRFCFKLRLPVLVLCGLFVPLVHAREMPQTQPSKPTTQPAADIEVPDWLPDKYHKQHRQWLRARRRLQRTVTIDLRKPTWDKLEAAYEKMAEKAQLKPDVGLDLFLSADKLKKNLRRRFENITIEDMLDKLVERPFSETLLSGTPIWFIKDGKLIWKDPTDGEYGADKYDTPYQAYRRLLIMREFHSSHIGAGGQSSFNWHAYEVAQQIPNASSMFHNVLRNAKPGGKAYAMRWFWHNDRETYNKAFEKLRGSQAPLDRMIGCMVAKLRLGEFIREQKKRLERAE